MPKSIAKNRNAYRNFAIDDKFECGVSLPGGEVKSIKANRVNINNSFVRIIKKSLVHKEVLFIVLALILYYWAMSVLFEPLVRYLIPALGVLLILLPGLWASRSRDSVTG